MNIKKNFFVRLTIFTALAVIPVALFWGWVGCALYISGYANPYSFCGLTSMSLGWAWLSEYSWSLLRVSLFLMLPKLIIGLVFTVLFNSANKKIKARRRRHLASGDYQRPTTIGLRGRSWPCHSRPCNRANHERRRTSCHLVSQESRLVNFNRPKHIGTGVRGPFCIFVVLCFAEVGTCN